MQTGIHVGSTVDKQSLEPLTDAIIRIMQVETTPKTIRAGLDVLARLGTAAVSAPINISHCSIGMPVEEPRPDDTVT